MPLSKEQFKQLAAALVSAFPRKTDLERMLRFGMGENLATIAGDGALHDLSFRLLEWAESRGLTAQLVRAALDENPHNPELGQFAKVTGLAALPPPPQLTAPTQGKAGILIDLSHGQDEWESPLFRDDGSQITQLVQPSAADRWELRHIRHSHQISADALKAWSGLIFAIPHHVRIEEQTRYELVQWVRQGGRLVLLGFELGERHHETNLNELANEFGVRFNSDIVAPKGWKPFSKPWGAPVDFADLQSPHPLFSEVNSLRLWNLGTLSVEPGADILLTLGNHAIGWLQREGVNYTTKGWLRGGNQQFGIIRNASWVPVVAEAPKGLTGKGSVLAIGTWELLARQGSLPAELNNQRFVANLFDWCAPT